MPTEPSVRVFHVDIPDLDPGDHRRLSVALAQLMQRHAGVMIVEGEADYVELHLDSTVEPHDARVLVQTVLGSIGNYGEVGEARIVPTG